MDRFTKQDDLRKHWIDQYVKVKEGQPEQADQLMARDGRRWRHP